MSRGLCQDRHAILRYGISTQLDAPSQARVACVLEETSALARPVLRSSPFLYRCIWKLANANHFEAGSHIETAELCLRWHMAKLARRVEELHLGIC